MEIRKTGGVPEMADDLNFKEPFWIFIQSVAIVEKKRRIPAGIIRKTRHRLLRFISGNGILETPIVRRIKI